MDAILSSNDCKRMTDALTEQYQARIADIELQIERISTLKSSLYESLINGVLTKDDYKSLRDEYRTEETRLLTAHDTQREELENIKSGNDERLRWTENFKQFEGLTALDRRMVISLISSIKVVSKTELEITFNYQDEFESAVALLERKVA